MSKTLHEIIATKESAEASLLQRAGVTAVDVGYKYVGGVRTEEVAIRVMVARKRPDVDANEKVPSDIQGVKTDVIERTYFLHAGAAAAPVAPPVPGNRKKVADITLQADAGNYDPVKGGISIGPCRAVGGYVYVGTLGAIVKDNATGNPLLLSNFHVMCIDNGWHAGDTMAQPGRVDGGSCPANVVGTLQRAQLTSLVDCAVSSLSGRGYSCEIADIGKVAGTAAATLGQAVRKRGRTTGLTYGFVESVSLSVNIDYGAGIGTKTLTNQIGIRPDTAHNAAFGDHGDSGSAVVDAGVHVVGLHFAGSSDGHGIANVISNVMTALNVSMCTGSVTKLPMKDIKDAHVDTKLVKNETKDHKTEKVEIKEPKIEKIEVKDHKIEKLEHKELEKVIVDQPPGKGPVETGPGQGPGLGPVAGGQGAASPMAAKTTDKQFKDGLKAEGKDKEIKQEKSEVKEQIDKVHKDGKDVADNAKRQKDNKEGKDNKDNKDNKEHKEQKEHKDAHESKPQKDVKDHKDGLKEHLKEIDKHLSIEQFAPKLTIENGQGLPTSPGFPGDGGLELRMSQLEASVAALSTFITGDLRPDLSTGALTNESDGCKGC